ncbi:TPA: Rpn family recombination-promoting nuclease/putative transposase [Candidatus Peregrinibacteria bacterium]|nr:Rpn family recombination-promoting nuclease/putative transposase [Candidatus Peregrinibacteria bacterium]
MFPESDKYINSFKLLEKEKFINYSDDIELIFVELPKFTKNINQVESIQDRWIYFIKNAGSLEFQPKNWNAEFDTAFTTINEANLSVKELEIQHKRKEFIYIRKSSIELATQSGIEKGMQSGIEKGEKNKALEIAKNLIAQNIENSIIIISTGLSEEEIQELR